MAGRSRADEAVGLDSELPLSMPRKPSPVEPSSSLRVESRDEYTPPASPRALGSPLLPPKASFGHTRPRQPLKLPIDDGTPLVPRERRFHGSTPESSSPPLPPSPNFPRPKRDSSRSRYGAMPAVSSPLNEVFPRTGPSSPTWSMASSVRQASGTTFALDGSARCNPLGSNPVSVRDWRSSRDDAAWISQYRSRGQTTSAPGHAPPVPVLRSASSIPDYLPYRLPGRNAAPAPHRSEQAKESRDSYQSLGRPGAYSRNDEVRSSIRSGWTNASSAFLDASGTERSSIATGRSSRSDRHTNSHDAEYPDDVSQQPFDDDDEDVMSVEDAIDMYFYNTPPARESASASKPRSSRDTNGNAKRTEPERRRSEELQPADQHALEAGEQALLRPARVRPRSNSTGVFDRQSRLVFESPPPMPDPMPLQKASTFQPKMVEKPAAMRPKTPARLVLPRDQSPPAPSAALSPRPLASPMSFTVPTSPTASVATWQSPVEPRDRYGFKKQTVHVSLAEHDAWSAAYEKYVKRRSHKWHALMKQHGLPTTNPDVFPPRSDKVKRYMRKGLPPEWRGAAWFWYSDGPAELAKHHGLFAASLARARNGELTETDRDSIERDLHRTFPDNVRFKPDAALADEASPSADMALPAETPLLGSLRHVLQAFAVHNVSIGYCQSLNFLAGLLLLFVEDEEKAFVLLKVITERHLPGAHARSLTNVDVGVLMALVHDTMPAVWARINDVQAGAPPTRLPTIHLSTTSWFMSAFVSNMPVETVLRVWDSFLYEGAKTLFRVGLALFKTAEPQLRALGPDHMDLFTVVQNLPRRMLDPNRLFDTCFDRRHGFAALGHAAIDKQRADRQRLVDCELGLSAPAPAPASAAPAKHRGRDAAGGRFKRSLSRKRRPTRDV